MISVLLPTRNPHAGRFHRTLEGLATQTLPRAEWELLVVDNGSAPLLTDPAIAAIGGRVVCEPLAGLTRARLTGLREARGDIIVFVDDDNVLNPHFLQYVRDFFARYPRLGAIGGPVTPDFEQIPPGWTREFFGLLALRDSGPAPIIATGGPAAPWPECAPVGAGLCMRREAAAIYERSLASDPTRLTLDRRGRELTSGGDNDLVFTALHGGWDVGYFPELSLIHLIPSARLEADYLARLNQGIQRSWVRVLALHGHNPWPAIPRWSVPLRSARAWVRSQAWRSPANRIRWRGLHGRFLGQADLSTSIFRVG